MLRQFHNIKVVNLDVSFSKEGRVDINLKREGVRSDPDIITDNSKLTDDDAEMEKEAFSDNSVRELRRSILDAGWKSSKHDECLYYCHEYGGKIALSTISMILWSLGITRRSRTWSDICGDIRGMRFGGT